MTSLSSNSNGTTTPRWQYIGDHGHWYDFSADVNSTINTELENGTTIITYIIAPFTYALDISSMTQMNTDTSTPRRVRCISGIPSKWTRNGTELSDTDGALVNDALSSKSSHVQLSSGESININWEMAVTPRMLPTKTKSQPILI
tara:strand:- start:8 stop:442 length:435 start_codon:yes stop_codon:yes gene_type:complete